MRTNLKLLDESKKKKNSFATECRYFETAPFGSMQIFKQRFHKYYVPGKLKSCGQPLILADGQPS